MTIDENRAREVLSFDARCIAGAWFGMMSPGKGDVTFQLREGRPSDRAVASLLELKRAGFISIEEFNRYGGVVCRAVQDMRWAFDWLGQNRDNPDLKWPITQPLKGGEKEGRKIRKELLA